MERLLVFDDKTGHAKTWLLLELAVCQRTTKRWIRPWSPPQIASVEKCVFLFNNSVSRLVNVSCRTCGQNKWHVGWIWLRQAPVSLQFSHKAKETRKPIYLRGCVKRVNRHAINLNKSQQYRVLGVPLIHTLTVKYAWKGQQEYVGYQVICLGYWASHFVRKLFDLESPDFTQTSITMCLRPHRIWRHNLHPIASYIGKSCRKYRLLRLRVEFLENDSR